MSDYKPHEARIHEAVFDTVSKPLHNKEISIETSTISPTGTAHQQKNISNSKYVHVTWNHFGQKAKFHLDPNRNLYETLSQRVREEIPVFRGNLAFKNDSGHEILLQEDGQLREALARKANNHLKVFTTLSALPTHHLTASQIGSLPASRAPSAASPDANSESPLLRKEISLLERACEEVRKDNNIEGTKRETPESAQPLQQPLPVPPLFPFPAVYRGCWIGPNKFIWGHGGWGGWGPIPSYRQRAWPFIVDGGRPPW